MGGSVIKNLPANAGDTGSIPGLGRSPGGGIDNSLQYSCLENSGKWTEEPTGLLSMGSQRVRHSWAAEHVHECYLNLGLFFSFVTFFLWHMCFWVNISGEAQKHTCWQLYFPYYASLLWVNSYDLSHESQANQIYVHGTITKLLGMLVMGHTCSVCLDS